MDGKIDIFTIMFLVLAVVIILKLRSVLGRRTTDDEARIKVEEFIRGDDELVMPEPSKRNGNGHRKTTRAKANPRSKR